MARKTKKKVWKAPDWLPHLRKLMKRGARAFNLEMIETVDLARDYKAPHANRPTPERPHHDRGSRVRVLWSDVQSSTIASRRLFRGHRA